MKVAWELFKEFSPYFLIGYLGASVGIYLLVTVASLFH